MAFCGKCGTKVEEGVKFCPGCGAQVMAQAAEPQEQNQEQKSDFASKVASLNDTPDNTADFDKADIEQNKFMAILGYLSWLVLIPIFAAKESKFARFHANQGLVLAIVEAAWWIVEWILSSVFWAISWRLSFISTILSLVNIVFLVLAILGIVNAANGKAKELPVIGKIKILK